MKSKIQIVLIALFLLVVPFTMQAASNYKSCKVYLFNGESFECTGYVGNGYLEYRIDPNDKPQKILASKVKFVVSVVNDTTVIINSGFPYVPLNNSLKGDYKKTKTGRWLNFVTNPFENKVSIFKVYLYSEYKGYFPIYGLYRQGDEYGVLMYMHTDDEFRKRAPFYLTDCPEILEYIKTSKAKIKSIKDLEGVIEEYNKCLESK